MKPHTISLADAQEAFGQHSEITIASQVTQSGSKHLVFVPSRQTFRVVSGDQPYFYGPELNQRVVDKYNECPLGKRNDPMSVPDSESEHRLQGASQGARDHNAWCDELKADVEFEPLRDFIDRLKE